MIRFNYKILNGKYLKWVVVKKQAKDNEYIESNKYNDIDNLIFSPDGKSFAFVAVKNGKWIVIKDGIESDKYNQVYFLKYSPDSKSFIYVGKKDQIDIMIKDWNEISRYKDIQSPLYSPNSESLAYIARKKIENG